MFGFRGIYLPGGGGGFMRFTFFWIVAFVVGPTIYGLLMGKGPGFGHAQLPPLFYVIGGGALLLSVGSYYLQRSVEAEKELPFGGNRINTLAESLGLWVEEDPKTKKPMMSGKRGKYWLQVRMPRKRIALSIRHHLSLPSGFRISHPETARTSKQQFGNPVLDNALQLEGGDGLPIDWSNTALTATLMAALHPYPGALMDSRSVVIDSKALKRDALDQAIEDAITLIQAMANPPKRSEKMPKFPGR